MGDRGKTLSRNVAVKHGFTGGVIVFGQDSRKEFADHFGVSALNGRISGPIQFFQPDISRVMLGRTMPGP